MSRESEEESEDTQLCPEAPNEPTTESIDSLQPRGINERIGRYQLLQKIGEGGFGIVYMAEQREPVKRRVALKVIRPGLDTTEVLARFEAES